MFRDPKVPASYVEVDVLRSWLYIVLESTHSVPGASQDDDPRQKLIAGLRQRISGALATHNPPTGELVVESGHFLQVLTNCTCSMVSAGVYSHEPGCQLDVFGPVEDFVRPLRKAGYVVIEPGAVEGMLTPEPPADVDACVCDVGPDTDGPSIECPQHGEPYFMTEMRREREHRQLREGNWTKPEGPDPKAMRSIGYAMQYPTTQVFRPGPVDWTDPSALSRALNATEPTLVDEVGERQLRLREAAQRLNRVGHDLGSTELLAISRDLTAELGAGWSEVPTVSALREPVRSPGSGDTGEPPLGATLSQEDVERGPGS